MNKFPLSVATGSAFCNRKEELAKLKIWLLQKQPTLIMSPRRYGKTSLVLKAIKATKFPYTHIDLFSIVDEEDIEKLILSGVANLISQIGTTAQKALKLASKVFGGTQVKVSLTKLGIEVDFNRSEKKPAYRILEVLERLDSLAEHAGKPIIIFFDEFQTISEISTNHSVEAVLRQVAQLSKSVSFVFSGSNRHLLRQMFEDRNRPFYKLCEKLTLERISEEAYSKHITTITKSRWNTAIDSKAIARIFFYSERHPYYVNLICSRMLINDQTVTAKDIDALWQQYILEEKSDVAAEVDLLSSNQRKLLTIIARENGHKALSGKEFIKKANMSKASIAQSYEYLIKKDYLYKDSDDIVHVLDPLIKYVLSA